MDLKAGLVKQMGVGAENKPPVQVKTLIKVLTLVAFQIYNLSVDFCDVKVQLL